MTFQLQLNVDWQYACTYQNHAALQRFSALLAQGKSSMTGFAALLLILQYQRFIGNVGIEGLVCLKIIKVVLKLDKYSKWDHKLGLYLSAMVNAMALYEKKMQTNKLDSEKVVQDK